MTKAAELTAFLFDGLPQRADAGRLAGELLRWMDASTRFTAFVETYRDKIRKKIRVARDAGSLLDLRGELLIAACLLADRRLALAYEPAASEKRRSPDFGVTYRTNLLFQIEVARMRVEAQEMGETDVQRAAERKQERILRILLDKLSQMQPGAPNLLVIQTIDDLARAIDLNGLMQAIKLRADSKDAALYAASRYAGPADFYKDFLRLTAVVLWGRRPAQVWINRQARPALDEKVLRMIGALPCALDEG